MANTNLNPVSQTPIADRLYSLLKTLQIAMLVMALFYVGLGEIFRRSRIINGNTIFYVVLAIAIMESALVLYIRRQPLSREEDALRTDSENRTTLAAIRKWYVIALAFSVGVSMLGFTLRVMGSPMWQASIFYGGGLALVVVCAPRRPV